MNSRKYWENSLDEMLPRHGIEPTKKLKNDIINISLMEEEYSGITDALDRELPPASWGKKKHKCLT